MFASIARTLNGIRRKLRNLMKFGDMAHVQNNESFHRPTSLMLENTLVVFTAK